MYQLNPDSISMISKRQEIIRHLLVINGWCFQMIKKLLTKEIVSFPFRQTFLCWCGRKSCSSCRYESRHHVLCMRSAQEKTDGKIWEGNGYLKPTDRPACLIPTFVLWDGTRFKIGKSCFYYPKGHELLLCTNRTSNILFHKDEYI